MKRLAHRVQMFAIRAVVSLLARFPLSTVQRFGERLGHLAYRPLGIRRLVVERQIQAAFPGLNGAEAKRLARASYAHFGRVVMEIAVIAERAPDTVATLFEGADDLTRLDDASRDGQGIVLVTGHVGSWEMAAAYIAARGYRIDAVARHMQNPFFDAYLKRMRERFGMRVVFDDEAVRVLPRALRDGRFIALVSDQGVKGLASAFVPFFGRPAKTPRGAAVFAHRFEAPALFLAAMRQPSGKYWLHAVEIPVEYEDDGDAVIDQTVAAYTRILESFVRRYPEQYFWLHRRWRRQPPETPPELRDPVTAVAEGT